MGILSNTSRRTGSKFYSIFVFRPAPLVNNTTTIHACGHYDATSILFYVTSTTPFPVADPEGGGGG